MNTEVLNTGSSFRKIKGVVASVSMMELPQPSLEADHSSVDSSVWFALDMTLQRWYPLFEGTALVG